MRVYQTVKNTGIAVILDCGEYCNIHPVDKRSGTPSVLQARRLVYGETELQAFGLSTAALRQRATPSHRILPAERGWYGGEPVSFEIAGADGVYHPARLSWTGTPCGSRQTAWMHPWRHGTTG